ARSIARRRGRRRGRTILPSLLGSNLGRSIAIGPPRRWCRPEARHLAVLPRLGDLARIRSLHHFLRLNVFAGEPASILGREAAIHEPPVSSLETRVVLGVLKDTVPVSIADNNTVDPLDKHLALGHEAILIGRKRIDNGVADVRTRRKR